MNAGDRIDAIIEFLVVHEHKLTVRWRTLTVRNGGELVQRKNISSSDRGGTETAEVKVHMV